jgi:hypothetical protein
VIGWNFLFLPQQTYIIVSILFLFQPCQKDMQYLCLHCCTWLWNWNQWEIMLVTFNIVIFLSQIWWIFKFYAGNFRLFDMIENYQYGMEL